MTVWTGTLPSIVAGAKTIGTDGSTMAAALAAVTDPWTSYVPAWTSTGTQPAIGNGSISGKYLQAGKLVIATVEVVMGGTTTYGTGTYQFSLPTSTADALGVGQAILYDASTAANRKPGAVYRAAATIVQVLGDTGLMDPTNPFTWASGDVFRFTYTYEAA